MSMILFACVAAGAAAVGWVSGRKARERHDLARGGAVSPTAPNPFADYPCGLKDVLARTKDDEVLLSGGLRLSESGAPVAAIFFGTGPQGAPRQVVAFPGDRTEFFWLSPEQPQDSGAEPPSSIELQGIVLERSRRLPVIVERFGTDVPPVDREAIFAEYRGGSGQVAFLLRGPKATLCGSGEAASVSSVERYPGA